MTRKLRDLNAKELCQDAEHSPAQGEKTYEPGLYEHLCPACGNRTEFIVLPGSYLAGKR